MSKKYFKRVGNIIREARKAEEMTSQQLGERLGYINDIRGIEEGRRMLPIERLEIAIKLLGLNRNRVSFAIYEDYLEYFESKKDVEYKWMSHE